MIRRFNTSEVALSATYILKGGGGKISKHDAVMQALDEAGVDRPYIPEVREVKQEMTKLAGFASGKSSRLH